MPMTKAQATKMAMTKFLKKLSIEWSCSKYCRYVIHVTQRVKWYTKFIGNYVFVSDQDQWPSQSCHVRLSFCPNER